MSVFDAKGQMTSSAIIERYETLQQDFGGIGSRPVRQPSQEPGSEDEVAPARSRYRPSS